MRFGFVGASYTAQSKAVADEECINFYAETAESQGSVSPGKAYGGSIAQGLKNYFSTPGLAIFAVLPESPVRGQIEINGSLYVVAGTKLCQVSSTGVVTVKQTLPSDGKAVSMATNGAQIVIITAGQGFCYVIAIDFLANIADFVGTPGRVRFADGYFIVNIVGTNKFQFSDLEDGNSWPGLNVNAVSVFPDNVISIEVNHRELWVHGLRHSQPYQNTGSNEVWDPIPGTLIEKGCANLGSPCLADNSVFWIDQDDRGGRSAWRSNGYTPQRISTHAVEIDLQAYTQDQIADMQTYAYQEAGHLFWVIYVPNASWTWVYDVGEQLWHKRAYWQGTDGPYTPHRSWNHTYVFGKHLVGDWNSQALYEMHIPVDNNDGSYSFVTDAGNNIRRLRRAPTITNEKNWIYHSQLTIDFATGLGPQPPLTDGSGNPRPPQAMLRWSDNRGFTWSNEHWRDCGFAGEYSTRVWWMRLGRSRNRVYELIVSDPIPWTLTDAYLEVAA